MRTGDLSIQVARSYALLPRSSAGTRRVSKYALRSLQLLARCCPGGKMVWRSNCTIAVPYRFTLLVYICLLPLSVAALTARVLLAPRTPLPRVSVCWFTHR